MIKNILFDLGAVILNLDMSRTDVAFAALTGCYQQHQKIRKQLHQIGLFERFETDEVKEKEFIATLKAHNPLPLSDGHIRIAWSAMLLDMPAERVALLKELRQKGYKLFLLSNINSIHLEDVYAIIEKEHPGLDFDALFDKPYYSHLIERRKPHLATYEYVLKDAGIQAEETLFIDDNADNIAGAKQVGLHTIHHIPNSDLRKSLSSLLPNIYPTPL